LATRSKCGACKVAGLQELFRDWMKDVGAKELSPNSAYDLVDLLFNTRD
jgi:hypothetical protein